MVSPRVPSPRSGRQSLEHQHGQVRIIGGSLRGSKLPVFDRPGLRPTSDRVRETLFNWLQGELHGCRCLDLFAGSGALGFEAASRGAARVLMVERDPDLAASLCASAQRLHANAVEVRCADALQALRDDLGGPFDLVLLDPPFADDPWTSVIETLPAHLANPAWIYIEAAPATRIQTPEAWRRHRHGHTREVHYTLFRREA